MAPPVKTPEAANCCVDPSAIVAVAGETAIDVTVADVRVVVPATLSNDAAIVVVPVVDVAAVARPLLLIDAIPALEDVHVANEVRS